MFLFCKGYNRVIAKKSLLPVSYNLIVHPRAITAEVLDVDEILILKKSKNKIEKSKTSHVLSYELFTVSHD